MFLSSKLAIFSVNEVGVTSDPQATPKESFNLRINAIGAAQRLPDRTHFRYPPRTPGSLCVRRTQVRKVSCDMPNGIEMAVTAAQSDLWSLRRSTTAVTAHSRGSRE